jgi:transposase
MDVVYPFCAGMDVHKKTIVVCCMTPDATGAKQIETRTFGTMTQDLLALSDWLIRKQITHVAMESTGELWKPVYNILEGSVTVLLVNAQHMKTVPGRKTDVQDAEWIADLLRHGLLKGSFVPPLPQRDLRDLTRQRSLLVRERADVVNRLHKVLEWANIKLTSVATDVTGASGRAMLEAMVAGQADPVALAELAKGRLRNKQHELVRALDGRIREHHRFMIAQHLIHIEFLDEQIALFDATIAAQIASEADQTTKPPAPAAPGARQIEQSPSKPSSPSWQHAVALFDTIPGVGVKTAEKLVAEIGADMSRFPTEAHLSSWAKLSPGNNESAGKRHSGRTGRGNPWLRSALIEAAWAAVKVKDCYLSAIYHRLAGRRGAKKAITAVAHHILIAVYYMLKRDEPYQDHGPLRLDEQRKSRLAHQLQYRLEKLGYSVKLEPTAAAAS